MTFAYLLMRLIDIVGELPMSSPISDTLANAYVDRIEKKHILNDKNSFVDNIKMWLGYVDDILCK